jgi:hypothetical protein
MKRIINKWTYATLKKVVNEDDLVVTNDINDDTADIRVIATDEQFENASGHDLLNYYERA